MTAIPVHSSRRNARPSRAVVAAILAALLVVTAGIVLNTAPARAAETDDAVVVRVIDGDTVVMKVNGKQARVRLLNVDTPETKDPSEPVQCMGPEASAFLTKLLPKGAKVTLKYDTERQDRYGRTLAAVFTSDKKFVSAEIAKRGLGMAVTFGDNDAYFEKVQAAQALAQKNRTGLYSTTIACTVPTQVKALKQEMTDVAAADAATAPSDQVAGLVARSAAVVAALVALRSLADHDETDIAMGILLTTPKLRYAAGLRDTSATALSLHKELVVSKARAVVREAAAAQAAAEAAAAAAAARAEAEAAAAAASAQAAADARAAADRASARAAADAAARANSRPAPAPYVAPAAPDVAPPASGGGDTYTGCRAYGNNGTSVDNKGRRYTKIPC